MLEQKKNEGKGASSSAGTPQFKVNVVARSPLPKRSMRRGVDKHEPAEIRAPMRPPHSAKAIVCGSRVLQMGGGEERIMAGSVNKVILVGNLGKDPEVRRLNSGDQVVSFSLATSENWRDKTSGERKEKHRVA